MNDVNVFDRTVEAARKAGAVYPEALAEFLKDDLVVVNTLAGPQVALRNGLECESLDTAMARLKATGEVGALFSNDKVDVRKISIDMFQSLRKHNPEVLGLRKRR